MGTIYFSGIWTDFDRWICVEHDLPWTRKIGEMNSHERVHIEHVDMATNPAKYLEYPMSRGPFDFILVDGRMRMDCLNVCLDLLSHSGVAVLHDANRGAYRPLPAGFEFSCLFRDYRTLEGGIWIGSRKHPIRDVIDLDRHLSEWAFFAKRRPGNI